MESALYLHHGIPAATMPLPPAMSNRLCFSSRRSSLSLSCGFKKTLKGRVIECSNGKQLERQASFKSTATKLGALKSLLDVKLCLSQSKTAVSERLTLEIGDMSSPSVNQFPPSVNQFKMNVVKRMGPAEATDTLKKEYEKHKDHIEIRFDLDIALAEVLISQGKYEEALERECIRDQGHPSDLRPQLYKAIVHTMLALRFLEEFLSSQEIPDPVD